MSVSHGGDWAGFEADYGYPPLDFSASISPLGLPHGVQDAIAQSFAEADRYPDPLCRSLRQALSDVCQVPVEWILCGNGASDLIYRAALARRPRKALLCSPCFGEYPAALKAVACPVEYHPTSRASGFLPDRSLLQAIRPGVDLLFLTQPGNPSGRAMDRGLLLNILWHCQHTGTFLILDECFLDFLEHPATCTLAPFLKNAPNLLILRSFTKVYAMAGIRLGYALSSNTALLGLMARSGPPWSVSTLAQAAGVAALGETAYLQTVRALVRRERPRLQAELESLGLEVLPGEANFLLFRSPKPLLEGLARQGILLRCCADFPGLDRSWYRTTVRNRADNDRLLRALRQILAGWPPRS